MLDFTDAGRALIKSPSYTSINLFELYYDDKPDTVAYFAAWDEDVSFNGHVYNKMSIKMGDVTTDSDGKINDVQLTVGNADRLIQFYIEEYDLIGKKVRHIRIFEGISDYIQTTFKIKGATAKKDFCTFSLSLGVDFLSLEIPARACHARFCWHMFKGAECAYAGAETECDGTFDDCKRKGNMHRFGGFPAIPNERIYF